jgi:hypothetical protein
MADLMLFRQDADGRDVELRGSTVALEVELQRRIEAGMESMLGIRFLASEYPTGPWHRGRIDTLGLDENNAPVVVEYKKGCDSGILSQAVSYLSWLDSAHHEFEALVKARLGAEAAEAIDWQSPRMVCIAASFSRHDRVAVHRLNERIDLVRYRTFDSGLLSLLLTESTTGSPRPAPARRQRREREEAAGADGSSEKPSAQANGSCLSTGLVRRTRRGSHRLGRGRGGSAQALHRLSPDGEPRLGDLPPEARGDPPLPPNKPGHCRVGGGLLTRHAWRRASRDGRPGGTHLIGGRLGEGEPADPAGIRDSLTHNWLCWTVDNVRPIRNEIERRVRGLLDDLGVPAQH